MHITHYTLLITNNTSHISLYTLHIAHYIAHNIAHYKLLTSHLAQEVEDVLGVPPEGEDGLAVPVLHGHAATDQRDARVDHVEAEGEQLVASGSTV